MTAGGRRAFMRRNGIGVARGFYGIAGIFATAQN
jgi:hypothetical protein